MHQEIPTESDVLAQLNASPPNLPPPVSLALREISVRSSFQNHIAIVLCLLSLLISVTLRFNTSATRN